MPVTVVFDGQAGSCGKGKVVGLLAKEAQRRGLPMTAIDNFMSNAGHTYMDDAGIKVMTQHLPTSIINPNANLYIGPGAAIDPHILVGELERYRHLLGNRRVMIHPRAMIILPKHQARERETIKSGSTFKGCGAAQAEKIMRVPGIMLFEEFYRVCLPPEGDTLRAYCDVGDHIDDLNIDIENDSFIVVEGSQGLDLDINYGLSYPHVTSRQCNVSQLVADCGISPFDVTNAIMIIRPYPIRISSQTAMGEISSGDYAGSEEISWDIVKERSGAPADTEVGEMTTVTKRQRRVFEMNWERLIYAVKVNKPNHIFLNFVQYLDWTMFKRGTNNLEDTDFVIPNKVTDFINKVHDLAGVKVTGFGTGARNGDVLLTRDFYQIFK